MKISFSWERYYPILLACFFFLLFCFFKGSFNNLFSVTSRLISSVNGISSTLLGFFLTILTILHAISTRKMKFIKETGTFPLLVVYLKKAVFFNFIIIVLGLIFTSLDVENFDLKYKNLACYLYIFIFLLTIMYSFRFCSLFMRIIED